jgi:hypothetical protein
MDTIIPRQRWGGDMEMDSPKDEHVLTPI